MLTPPVRSVQNAVTPGTSQSACIVDDTFDTPRDMSLCGSLNGPLNGSLDSPRDDVIGGYGGRIAIPLVRPKVLVEIFLAQHCQQLLEIFRQVSFKLNPLARRRMIKRQGSGMQRLPRELSQHCDQARTGAWG